MEQLTIIIRFITALVATGIVTYGIRTAVIKFKTSRKRLLIARNEYAEQFTSQFNKIELRDALNGYIAPYCSPSDPNNREGEEFLANTREPLFDYIDRSIENTSRFFHILLADTGMGKTSFALNYYTHAEKKFSDLNIAILSLAHPDTMAKINRIKNKTSTILIADALDEDPACQDNARDRLDEILKASADFRALILTCRSQFFVAEERIPRETPIPQIVARGLNQAPNHTLERSFILPFGQNEIERYISKHFPLLALWKRSQRLRAFELAKQVPDLAYRPMLLEKLPELAISEDRSHELYDLYDVLVEGWINRERNWIGFNDLLSASVELALHIFSGLDKNLGRIAPNEIDVVATKNLGVKPEWKQLTARSLLNRDSRGLYKFAHKSILEFLLVKAACELGDDRPLELHWTGFMKELMISWGHTEKGRKKKERAKEILRSENGRKYVAPLFDMGLLSPVVGKPDFKRCAERAKSENGKRLPPLSWRSSSLKVITDDRNGIIRIFDRELNLSWSLFLGDSSTPNPTFKNTLDFEAADPDLRFPSYEQLISLIHGLEEQHARVLPRRRLYALADKPAKSEYMFAEINAAEHQRANLRVIDRPRLVEATDKKITTYSTGINVSLGYALSIKPIQLWLHSNTDSN